MNIFFVYILYSPSMDKYYVGFTSSTPPERLRKHNTNHKGFTGRNADWIIKYQEQFESKNDAMQREKEIKTWKSRRRIELLFT